MSIRRRQDAEGLVMTTVRRGIDVTTLAAEVREVSRRLVPGNEYYELLMIDAGALILRDSHGALLTVHQAKQALSEKSRGAIAIVAPTRLSRVWSERVASLLRTATVNVTVFDDESSARRWLRVRMRSARQEATTHFRQRDDASLPRLRRPVEARH